MEELTLTPCPKAKEGRQSATTSSVNSRDFNKNEKSGVIDLQTILNRKRGNWVFFWGKVIHQNEDVSL
jgi:hypothetical protein